MTARGDLVIAAVLLLGAHATMTARDLSTAGNVFALVAYGSIRPPFARLMFAAFDDGTIVWSRDRVLGGAPYFTAVIERDRLLKTLECLGNDGLFSQLPLVGGGVLCSECSCFIVRKEGAAFGIESSHEFFEDPGKCVAEHRGIVPQGSRKRFEVLSRKPSDYLFLRLLWLELRRVMETLIPNAGIACNGELEMLQTRFRWLPEA